ncbi:MAG: hypothetical protein KIG69_02455, partial [Eubacteriales bacterium]|nr:hypothetical protein [Eubacteriales bacterium]
GTAGLCSLVTSAPQMQAVMMSFSMDSDSSFQIILFCGKRTLRKTEVENRLFPFGVCFLLKTAFPRQ